MQRITLAWLVAFFLATVLQTMPLQCNWEVCETLSSASSNYAAMYVCLSATDVVLNVIILCLPVLYMRGLRMRSNLKVALVGVFGLGAL